MDNNSPHAAEPKAKILVVDDEVSIVEVLKALLKREGFQVKTTGDGTAALKMLGEEPFDLVISDIRMKPMDGISLLQQIRQIQSHIAVIMMTAYATVETAVEAMKEGAFDYICKPFKIDELLLTVQRALSCEHALAENEVLKESFRTTKYHYGMVGDSEKMERVYELVERVARTESTVLLMGETGIGKKMVAKALHAASRRAEQPLLFLNCASLPETLLETELFGFRKGAFDGAVRDKKGLFEQASGGTLVLEEIGSMPLGMQSKLLKVLQERAILPLGAAQPLPVDVRIIATTNEHLEAKIKSGQFREDLHVRISVIPIEVPPLRDRPGDVTLLVNHFLGQINEREGKRLTLEKQAFRALKNYDWPGNVRELENALTRAGALCQGNLITINDLPPEVQVAGTREDTAASDAATQLRGVSLKAFLRAKEHDYIQFVLNQCGGNKEKAAEALGISLATFYRKYGE
ncbi:MAG: sigma-54 dependent transcriptional regulator [Lentisphaeria bacterium]